jgi:alpha-L-rhamnosidase
MNSFNHYAYGAIGDWLYGVVAGIKITEPGYKMVTLSPQPDQRLGYVTASVKTPYGELISSWEYGNETVKYQFTIPEGITAHIILPNGHSRTVSGGGCICLHDAV